MNRREIADLIISRLQPEIETLQVSFRSSGAIKYFALDNLLPDELALRIDRKSVV